MCEYAACGHTSRRLFYTDHATSGRMQAPERRKNGQKNACTERTSGAGISCYIQKKCLKCFSLDSLIIFLNNSEKSIKVNNFGTQHPEETRHQKKI